MDNELTFRETETLLIKKMNELVPVELYPKGVLPFPAKRIAGTAFFPGGCGLHLKKRTPDKVCFPFKDVMILGHNFDSEKAFRCSREWGEETLNRGAWRGILALLKAAEVPPEVCFFTNAFMGLCAGDDSNIYRGRSDKKFRAACLLFLKMQIEIQRPRFIVTFGPHVPPLLAEASNDLRDWNSRGLRITDCDPRPFVLGARFVLETGSLHRGVVVPIAHPARGPSSSRNRRPEGFSPGNPGEIELLRFGWKAAQKLPNIK